VNLDIDSVRQVFADNNHNAFTDLCRFNGHIYLAFRSCPDGHGISRHAKIRVLQSADEGQNWNQVFEFSVPHRDTRDPHFLVFQNTLFVYSGTWLCPEGCDRYDINDHLGYAAWTTNETQWNGPRSLEGTYGHYIWRAAAHNGKAFLCGRRKRDFAHEPSKGEGGEITESALLESDDGLVFRFRSRFQTTFGDETAFLFEDDGSILALARCLQGRNAQICRAKPPFDEWTRTDLDRYVGGPMIVKWGSDILAAGRKTMDEKPPVTTLYELVDDQLRELTELPSGGDNSYTGFLQLSETTALVSYYSSHETGPHAAIYLATVTKT
jgi:hypothetical protein